VLVLLFAFVQLVGGGGGPGTENPPTTSDVQPAGNTQPAGGGAPGATAAAGTESPTPTAPPEPLPGTPYAESAVRSAFQARGLNASIVDQPFTCQGANTTPRTYRVTGGGGQQDAVLLVYQDAATLNGDWVIGGGRPQYRNGSCAANAAVIYFNANLLLVLPQTTSAGLQSQIVDAFLTLP
jgi:hypothetical protein